MTIKIYIYEKCSTCNDAMKFLKERKLSFITKEITKTPPSLSELRQMLNYYAGDIKKLFNTSGLMYRELKLNEKLSHMSVEESLELLCSNGMLIKRPFLLSETNGLVGFKEEQWKNFEK